MSCYENAVEYIKVDTTATLAPGLLLIFCIAILLKHSAGPTCTLLLEMSSKAPGFKK